MEPSLFSGDRILVNKWTRGARLFDVFAATKGEEVDIYRMPGLGSFERNDVLVFNFPYPEGRWDSIGFDVMQYYVKRCVALPGDTLEIKKGFFKVRGVEEKLGNVLAQKRLATLTDSTAYGVVFNAFPMDGRWDWTIQEFGPLPVPCRGQVVRLDSMTVLLYRQLINWELGEKVRVEKNSVYVGDSLIKEYRFKENYYFVAGDKAENSKDSRYWGMLPEPYIVGKAVLIWKSVNPASGKRRWNRCFKRVK